MTATAEQLAQLRRMAAEPGIAPYTDVILQAMLATRALTDVNGEEPFTSVSQIGGVTTPVANDAWIPTYDLNAVAADIWDEKAGLLAPNFNFSADGGNYSRSEAFEHAAARARHYRSRRAIRSLPVATPFDSSDLLSDE